MSKYSSLTVIRVAVLAIFAGMVPLAASAAAEKASAEKVSTEKVPAEKIPAEKVRDGTAYETAALINGAGGLQIALPKILTGADVDRYRRIFALQETGRWGEADRLVATLKNRLLMGHVLAQRYLHPTKYRSQYKELKAWMAAYADHPDARRLYHLALHRKPGNWRAPKRPVGGSTPGNIYESAARGAVEPRRQGLSRSQRRQAVTLAKRIRWNVGKGRTLAAKKLLQAKQTKALMSTVQYDRGSARLGGGYFLAGRDDWALKWAGKAADRSGRYYPEAHWTAGLAAWRLGRLADASHHFEALAALPNASPWLISAGAFWAARVRLVDRRPEDVNYWLGVAAAYPRTFYGLLGRRMLGLPVTFQWMTPNFGKDALQSLTATAGGQRTLALIQVDERRRAERELRMLAARPGAKLAPGILALASRANMPALAMRLDGWLFPNGGGYDGATYPLTDWVPDTGFRVDRALIHAFIRQESGFNPKAKSWAGARGLMQLMPRTASFVAGDRRLRNSTRRTLFKPAINLELGQTYIEMLLGNDKIKGDLFLLAAAWNGGPGNLNKWRRKVDHMDDPLFFIESLPSRETRIFIERVLTNLWIYRHRLGQPSPSLDAIAAGDWPVYTALDRNPQQVAQDGEDRRRARVPTR